MFTTYSASAGSGKTFSLVVDYLTICFRNLCLKKSHVKEPSAASREEFRKILAITFTNNAALEMKKRILDVLNEFAFTPTDQPLPVFEQYYEKIVAKVFGEHPGEEPSAIREHIRNAALLQLKSILYDYDRFSVTTIDKFNQKVIRSSALRLGLNLNYNVEIELEEFYQLVINKVMEDLRKGESLTERLLDALNHDMDVKGKSDIQQFLLDTLNLLYKNAEDNYDFLKRMRKLDNKAFEQQIKDWRTDVFDTIPKNTEGKLSLFTDLRKLLEKGAGVQKDGVNSYTFKRVLLWEQNPKTFLVARDSTSNYSYVCKLVNREYLNKNKSLDPATEAEISKKAIELETWVNDEVRRYFNEQLVLKYANKLLIIFDIQQKMDELKELRGLFFLSEANIVLHEELSSLPAGVSPEIYERQGYHYFFMDEFQDTSLMQWSNMKPLLENNAISASGDVFLFGDVKQAIYRWRNGDAEILHDLSSFETQNKHGHGFPTLSKENYSINLLQTNFRSKEAVIKFNNEFFKVYADNMNCQDLYKDVEQHVKEGNTGGLVQAYIHNKDQIEAGKMPTLPGSFSKLKEFVTKNQTLDAKSFHILYAVQDALNRGYSCKDILILFRKNDFLSEVAQLLINYGLKVETKKSLSLNQAPEVIAILETLKLILSPKDILAQANVISALSQIESFPDAYSQWIPQLQNKDANAFSKFIETQFGHPLPLKEWQKEPLFITILNIIDTYHLNKMESPFLNDFLDFVLDYLANRPDDIEVFLNRWEFLKENKKIPTVQSFAKQDAVSLMTIHGSKGMEFPVVIYPTKKDRSHELSFWADDPTDEPGETGLQRIAYVEGWENDFYLTDLKDRYQHERQEDITDALNVAYVAHTRAVEILYLVADESGEKDKTSYTSILNNFVHHAKKEKGESFFEMDSAFKSHYLSGDVGWRKTDKKSKTTDIKVVTPSMTVSDFSIQKLVMPELIPDDDPRTIGTKVHDYLSKINAFPQNEEEANLAGEKVPDSLRPYVMKFFQQILADDELKRFFGPDAKVYNEVSILMPNGETKRPDRVSILDGKVRVYDYKTGHFDSKYQDQLDEYCQLIREMGYEDVKGQLLFMN